MERQTKRDREMRDREGERDRNRVKKYPIYPPINFPNATITGGLDNG